jgi:hypothetical protein
MFLSRKFILFVSNYLKPFSNNLVLVVGQSFDPLYTSKVISMYLNLLA